MSFLKGLIVFSLLAPVNTYAAEGKNSYLISSAKMCALHHAEIDKKEASIESALTLDPENTEAKEIKLLPIHAREFKKSMKLKRAEDDAMSALSYCEDNVASSMDETLKKEDEIWDKVLLGTEFMKDRKYRRLDFSAGNILSKKVVAIMSSMNKSSNKINTRRLPGLYLSDDEVKMIEEFNIVCARVSSKNFKDCDNSEKEIARKLYPNYIFTKTYKTRFEQKISKMEKKEREKVCAKEYQEYDQAIRNYLVHQKMLIKIASSYNLEFDDTNFTAVEHLAEGYSRIVEISYHPTAEKIKQINKDLMSKDERTKFNAMVLADAKANPEVYVVSRYSIKKEEVAINQTIGGRITRKICDPKDMNAAFEEFKKSKSSPASR